MAVCASSRVVGVDLTGIPGGFEDGQTSIYNGSVIVERSLQLEEPVVYVSVNYRYVALQHILHTLIVRQTFRYTGSQFKVSPMSY